MTPVTAFLLVLGAWALLCVLTVVEARRQRPRRHALGMLAEHDAAVERLAHQLETEGAELLAQERRKGMAA